MPRTPRLSLAALFAALVLAGCTTPTAPRDADSPGSHPLHDQLPSGPARADIDASVKVNTQLAAAYLQAGRIEVAKEVIGRALTADSDSPLALAVQGLIFGETRDYVRGDESFRRAMRASPDDPDLNHNYATYLCRTARAAESVAHFEKALRTPGYPRVVASHAALGSCLLRLSRVSDAESHLRLVAAVEPTNAAALLGLAEVAFHNGDHRRARGFLASYNAAHPPAPQSLWLAIQLERAIGNRTEVHGLTADLQRIFPASEQAQAAENAQNLNRQK